MGIGPVQIWKEVGEESVEALPLKDTLTVRTEHVRCYGDQHLEESMPHDQS